MGNEEDIKALLLVGGMGMRLRSMVPSAPKPLASLGSRSFLELLVLQLRNQGIRRLVMCTGYLGDQIENEFGDGQSLDVSIEYSRELTPLGTAGAIKLARPFLLDCMDFVVMNGDSFLEADLQQLIHFHRNHGGLGSLAVVQVKDASRYGTVQISSAGRVTGFAEKAGIAAPGTVNAGIYVLDCSLLEDIPEGPASLERDIFPQVLHRGVYALEQQGMFIDIGTPEDYVRAQVLRDSLYEAAIEKKARPGLEGR